MIAFVPGSKIPKLDELRATAMEGHRLQVLDREQVVVAVDDARPLGYAVWTLMADEMHLYEVAVVPEARRTGLGRRLTQHALGRAIEAGATRSVLEVASDNRAALALYESLGYLCTRSRRNYYGVARDATEMVLPLEPS